MALRSLRTRVAEELIPELISLGKRLAEENLATYDDRQLAAAVEERLAALKRWTEIYWQEFIPFAHGVRQLGIYYNDAVRPENPYEFVGLLQGQQMLASRRNRALWDLAQLVRGHPSLADAIQQAVSAEDVRDDADPQNLLDHLRTVPGGDVFARAFEALLADLMDVAYDDRRLADRPTSLLRTVQQMAASVGPAEGRGDTSVPAAPTAEELERRLFDALGKERHQEAEEVIATAQLSWRLRDDDNILVGRLESQLLRALNVAVERLRETGRLRDQASVGKNASEILIRALRDPAGGPVDLPSAPTRPQASQEQRREGETPRQLVGQPASPGIATGSARCIQSPDDLGRFRAGEVLVCDAIQPTMTHLVPLASAIVERRGGMLIHGAIIARELGIPCVNGIAGATQLLHDGELVTVDGHLGIVTVGPPEFDLELAWS
jgi:pyruvate,water dikinase